MLLKSVVTLLVNWIYTLCISFLGYLGSGLKQIVFRAETTFFRAEQIVFRVEIFRHLKEVSDAINCGCGGDLEELMDEVERRKPFCYIRLG